MLYLTPDALVVSHEHLKMSHQLHPHRHAEVDTSPSLTTLLDQHRATSPLLDPQLCQTEAASTHEDFARHGQNPDSPQDDDTSVYNANDAEMNTQNGSLSISDNPTIGSLEAVLWKGLSLRSLAWEILGVILSICFLSRLRFRCTRIVYSY